MNIYLPMKNNLLDKGEGTIWTGGVERTRNSRI